MTEASREVGVVLRRRSIDNPWIDHMWSPAMILDEVPDTAPWTVLSSDADATIYYAGAASIDPIPTLRYDTPIKPIPQQPATGLPEYASAPSPSSNA